MSSRRKTPSTSTLVGAVELHCDGKSWHVTMAVGSHHETSGPHKSIKAAFKHARHWTECQLAVEALKVGVV
jgi:hypothetical protein